MDERESDAGLLAFQFGGAEGVGAHDPGRGRAKAALPSYRLVMARQGRVVISRLKTVVTRSGPIAGPPSPPEWCGIQEAPSLRH